MIAKQRSGLIDDSDMVRQRVLDLGETIRGDKQMAIRMELPELATFLRRRPLAHDRLGVADDCGRGLVIAGKRQFSSGVVPGGVDKAWKLIGFAKVRWGSVFPLSFFASQELRKAA